MGTAARAQLTANPQAMKGRYDPSNLFRLNHDIPPA